MKKILFRKLLLDYMSFFLIALFSSSIIIWVFQAVNFLDIMIEDGRDYMVYINYSLLNFPKILSKLFPFVIFFSLFYVTLRYENNNELMIFWSFGINKIQIINFIFKVSIFLMLLQIFLTSLIVPKSQDMARSFLRSSTVNFFGNFIKPKRFNDTIKGVTIYSGEKDENGNLFNIYIKKEIEDKEFQITYAKKGIFKKVNNIPKLVLHEGQTIKGKNGNITNFSFEKSDFPLIKLETNTTTYIKTQELSSKDLVKCFLQIGINQNENLSINIENCLPKNLNNILKELYKRFFIPLYIPLLMTLPLLLLITSKENLNYSRVKVFTFCFGLLVIIFSETSIRLISNTIHKNYSILIVPIIIFLFLYAFYLKNFIFIKEK